MQSEVPKILEKQTKPEVNVKNYLFLKEVSILKCSNSRYDICYMNLCGSSIVAALQRGVVCGNGISDHIGRRCSTVL